MLNLILIALTMQTPGSQGVFELYNYVQGERWTLTVTSRSLEQSPSWLESEIWPPLPPRQAGQIAVKQLATLVRDSERWRLQTISLRPTGPPGKWVYLVGIEGPPPRIDGGVHGAVTLIVLMDGTVVVPKRDPWPLR